MSLWDNGVVMIAWSRGQDGACRSATPPLAAARFFILCCRFFVRTTPVVIMSQEGNSGNWVRGYPKRSHYLGKVGWFKHMQYPRERKWPVVWDGCDRGTYLWFEEQRRRIGPDMPTRRHPLGRFAAITHSAGDLEEAILDHR